MAKPKPPEDQEAILIRLPKSSAEKLRELAAESRTANGSPLSANQYCRAIISAAVAAGTVVRERLAYDLIPSSTAALVAEVDPPRAPDK